MYNWENIQNKVEAETILGILLDKVKNNKIKKIYSSNNGCPDKIDNNKYEIESSDEDLYILFDNNYAFIIGFYNYSVLYIEYRELTNKELEICNNTDDLLNCHHEIHGWDSNKLEPEKEPYRIIDMECNYDCIIQYKVNGFHEEFDKWINTGKGCCMITIPAGGDYFNSISFILKNGIEIIIEPEPADSDGYYGIEIIDINNIIKYSDKKK